MKTRVLIGLVVAEIPLAPLNAPQPDASPWEIEEPPRRPHPGRALGLRQPRRRWAGVGHRHRGARGGADAYRSHPPLRRRLPAGGGAGNAFRRYGWALTEAAT